MDVPQPVRRVWAYRRWLLLHALLAAAAAYGISTALPSKYEPAAVVRIVPSQQAVGGPVSDASVLQLTTSYAEVARSLPVRERARELGNLRTSAEELGDYTKVSTGIGGVIRVSARTESPRSAAAYANAQANAFVEYVENAQEEIKRDALRDLEEQLAAARRRLASRNTPRGEISSLNAQIQQLEGVAAGIRTRPVDQANVIERAPVLDSPTSPKPRQNALIAFGGALLLGIAVAYGLIVLRNRFGSGEEAAAELELPLLGELPKAEPASPSAMDAVRALRTNVEFALRRKIGDFGVQQPTQGNSHSPRRQGGLIGQAAIRFRDRGQRVRPHDIAPAMPSRPGAVVLVTSPDPEAGKTYVTTSLAYAFAAEGHRAMAVDTDLRRPTLHERYGVASHPGVSDLLASNGSPEGIPAHVLPLDDAAQRRGGALHALAAGEPKADSSELLATPRMADLLTRLTEEFTTVLLDSPPVLGVTDPGVLARYADGVVLVIDAQGTTRRAARRAVQALRAVEAPILGFVFNRAARQDSYYGYGYGYGGDARPAQPPVLERS